MTDVSTDFESTEASVLDSRSAEPRFTASRKALSLTAPALILLIAGLLTSCGTSEPLSGENIPDNYPTIAPTVVQGRFDVVEVGLGDSLLPLGGPVAPTVAFDVVTGELQIEPDCNRYLGSFTLDADGTASMTVTGGTSEECPPGPVAEQDLLDAFATVDRWFETADGLELTGPGSTVIRLRRS